MALTNNDILKKLRVALKLKDSDIVEILDLVNFKITKSELGAFFRNEEHPKYMPAKDQVLRNFLNGLVIYKRGPMDKREKTPGIDSDKPKAKRDFRGMGKPDRGDSRETRKKGDAISQRSRDKSPKPQDGEIRETKEIGSGPIKLTRIVRKPKGEE